MLLHTPGYLVFLLAVAALTWALPRPAWRKWLLLAASYTFYSLFDLRFAALLFGLTAAAAWIGRRISASAQPVGWLWLGLALNLGSLAFFKYSGFFTARLQAAGLISPGLQILFPLGISFYIFQAVSYMVEIARGKLSPSASFLDLGLYLSFFPKLIAGPLVRPAAFLGQLASLPPSLPPPSLKRGLGLILLGLVKKVVVADSLAALGSTAFQAAEMSGAAGGFPTPIFIQGFYLYAIQIYADFSGYTDLARGSALLLGIELPENFQRPYWASSLVQFWNRWHMSLTQWFREYVFFPASRALLLRSQRRFARPIQVFVNLLTMIVIGWWHGSTVTFLLWGLWHGLLLSIEHLAGIKPTRRWARWVGWLVTFHLVGAGWILFRSSSIAAAGRFFSGLLAFEQMHWLPMLLGPVLTAAILTAFLDWLPSSPIFAGTPRLRPLRHILVSAAVVLLSGLALLSLARGSDPRPFIYGQF